VVLSHSQVLHVHAAAAEILIADLAAAPGVKTAPLGDPDNADFERVLTAQ
jgi:hypothetical protein